MSGIAGKARGAVAGGIPGVIAGLPWQSGAERVEEVVESPGDENVIVGGQHKRNDHCSKSHTWGRTGGGRVR